eukprot:Lankesteria_metandrocarpae@DN2057_c0_g1_i1.p1
MAIVPHLPVGSSGGTYALAHIQSGRKSGLTSPTIVLSGHSGEVYCCQFSPDGRTLATGSSDKTLLLYNVYGDCENFGVIQSHNSSVLELHWSSDGKHIYTASADGTVRINDVEEGKSVKRFKGHCEVVNSCCPSRRGVPLVVSGADDGTCRVWDLRTKKAAQKFEHPYQILSVAFDDSTERVIAGTLDHRIMCFDMRSEKETLSLIGHGDSITGISVSNDGNFLLSNSMDQSVKLWDIRPFFAGHDRCIATVTGAAHNFEKNLLRVRWDRKDDLSFAVGSSDRSAYIWSFDGGRKTPDAIKLEYRLPGHSGSVNEVCLHPNEPIIMSASSDKTALLGELS